MIILYITIIPGDEQERKVVSKNGNGTLQTIVSLVERGSVASTVFTSCMQYLCEDSYIPDILHNYTVYVENFEWLNFQKVSS